jgi:anthranilate phosphoribosyltransferase
MDGATLAAAMIGAQVGRLQLGAAASMLRMSAEQDASVAKMIDAAQQNMQSLANVAAGVGGNLDVSA